MKVRDLIYLLGQQDPDEDVFFLCIGDGETLKKQIAVVSSSNNFRAVTYLSELSYGTKHECEIEGCEDDEKSGAVAVVVDFRQELIECDEEDDDK